MAGLHFVKHFVLVLLVLYLVLNVFFNFFPLSGCHLYLFDSHFASIQFISFYSISSFIVTYSDDVGLIKEDKWHSFKSFVS